MQATERTRLQRKPSRGSYCHDDVYSTLDAAIICHVGFVFNGEARVLPTAFVRIGNAIYLHGHLHNRMLHALLDGQLACISVTHVDGLVLARSAFHHSVNYRSVVVYGRAELVADDEKNSVLTCLIDHLIPNRSVDLRATTPQELNATLVIKVPIMEASAKLRQGPPKDLAADYAEDTWAGVVNLKTRVSTVEPDSELRSSISTPQYVLQLQESYNA